MARRAEPRLCCVACRRRVRLSSADAESWPHRFPDVCAECWREFVAVYLPTAAAAPRPRGAARVARAFALLNP